MTSVHTLIALACKSSVTKNFDQKDCKSDQAETLENRKVCQNSYNWCIFTPNKEMKVWTGVCFKVYYHLLYKCVKSTECLNVAACVHPATRWQSFPTSRV